MPDSRRALLYCALVNDAANAFTAGAGAVFITVSFATQLKSEPFVALSVALGVVEVFFGVCLLLGDRSFTSTKSDVFRYTGFAAIIYAPVEFLILAIQAISHRAYFPAKFGTAYWWEFLGIVAITGALDDQSAAESSRPAVVSFCSGIGGSVLARWHLRRRRNRLRR